MSKRSGFLLAIIIALATPLTWAALGSDEPERKASSANGEAQGGASARSGTGGCTFDIECDDGNPCTREECDIAAGGTVGSGTCEYTNVAAGEPGGCGNGIFCDGIEFCLGGGNPICQDGPEATCCTDPGIPWACSETLGQCDDGRRCRSDTECGGARCDHCISMCVLHPDCDDGLKCNGMETCSDFLGGYCQPGTPVCGVGAQCSELRCSGSPATPCNSDQDCPTGQTCTQHTPVCFTGRCCSNDLEPVCSETRLRSPTVANPNPGLTCSDDWFPGDSGQIPNSGPCGGSYQYAPQGLGCPKYASGIAHIAGVPPAHSVQVGPVSISPAAVSAPQGPDGPFHRVGDDYALTGGSQILLVAMRIHGSMTPAGSAIVEFWDVSGFRIADAIVSISPALRVQRFDFTEEIIIPPNGFVTLRPSPSESPESRLYWSSAAQVEEGANDPEMMFVNDAPTAGLLGPGSRVLSFELLGNPGFWRAACLVNGECREETEWACNEMGGAFLFYNQFCAACTYGTQGELFGPGCRTCQGGSEPGNVYCTSQADCVVRGMGGSCLPNSALCAGSRCSNDNADTCTDDLDCPARPNGCSNADTLCSVDGDCPSGGLCGGAGTCEEGVCQPLNLTTGACCVWAGSCTENMTEVDCLALASDFLGVGTDCDPDCCPGSGQIASGADNCQDAGVHSVPALAASDPPYVITITGDNSGATSTNAAPDSCLGAAESVGSDRGWWEGFTLNSCARVRIDFCCSQPERSEVWRHMYVGCPCGEVISAAPDPNEESPYADGAGSPFCNDDNAWVLFGLLGPGTYYYPVRSSLPGNFGPYQMHITAQPCPAAACCLPGGGCQVMNQLACEAANGVFLGLPNKFPPVEDCGGGGACMFGSCCMGLGQCDDVSVDEEIMTEEACDAQSGTFIGGIRCHGCTCVNDPTHTCSIDADCSIDATPPGPGGPCDLNSCPQQAENLPTPCPFCPFEGPSNCQLPTGFAGFEAAYSDRTLGAGQLTADDFVPAPGMTSISELCVWGQNWGVHHPADPVECGPSVLSDNFRVRILGSTPFGLPDNYNVLGTEMATSQRAVIRHSFNGTYGVETYGYHLVLDDPITGLVPGNRYWLEVTNAMSATEPCYWMWQRQNTPTGNNFSAGGSGTRGYPDNYARTGDMTFCLVGTLAPPPQVTRPCCACDSGCMDGTLAECNAARSHYMLDAPQIPEGTTCVDFSCPSEMRPENDDCQNATPIPVGNNVISTFCATEDGHNPIDFGGPGDTGGVGGISGDVWFEFIAQQDCILRADMCATGDEYDSAIAIYSNGTRNCVCPLTQQIHDSTFLFAADETCTYGQSVGGAGFVETPAEEGQCFMIRAGLFAQLDDRGLGLLDVSCGAPICGDNSVNQPSEECDGIDDTLCPDGCQPDCTCGQACVCGDGVAACGEECDGADVENCFGPGCSPQCTCISTCGDGVREGSEECDGPADPSCGGVPGRCGTGGASPCQCPPAVCGNNFKDFNEECDGTDDVWCAGGPCRAPNDPAGECTCPCPIICRSCLLEPLAANPFGTCTGNNAACVVGGPACGAGTCDLCNQVRSISFQIPGTSAGSDTAIRVKLTSLYDVAPPLPTSGVNPGPALAPFEGQYRYLNTIPGTVSRCCNPASNPTACAPTPTSCNSDADCTVGLNTRCEKNLCPDSPAFGTYFRCARLGCTPEYRDWGSDFSGLITYVSGDPVVPDSTYHASTLASVCAGNEAACPFASAELPIKTERWGNVDCTQAVVPTAADLGFVVSKVKDAAGAFIKPRTQLREAVPNPQSLVGALDISRAVDAVKGRHYPDSFTISACP